MRYAIQLKWLTYRAAVATGTPPAELHLENRVVLASLNPYRMMEGPQARCRSSALANPSTRCATQVENGIALTGDGSLQELPPSVNRELGTSRVCEAVLSK